MSYLCRRVLLKNMAEETGGFVRLESDSGGCAVDARAEGVAPGARLVLLRGDGGVRDAGQLRDGTLRALLRGETCGEFVGAAIAHEGRALLFGGEGVTASLARQAAARTGPVCGEGEAVSRESAATLKARCSAVAVEPPAPETPPPEAPPPETPTDEPAAQQTALPVGVLLPALEAEPAAALPDQPAPPKEGWIFRHAGDGLRFDAALRENDRPVLHAEGFSAPRTPRPPPGLPRAQWRDGFWMEVYAASTEKKPSEPD